MALDEEALTGFRGGLAARRAPLEFGDEQWAKLHGFVIEEGGVLRSQWPLQRISGITDVVSLGVYHGPGETPFLIAVKGDGTVHWREAPPDDAEAGSSELSSAWLPVLTEDDPGGTALGPPGVSSGHRPLTTVPLEAGNLEHAIGGLRPALVLNSSGMGDSQHVYFIYEADSPASASERIRAMRLTSPAKWPADEDTDAAPKGEYGVIWSGVFVLGDIEWKADPDLALGQTNKVRYRNGLWLSVPGEVLRFDPLSVLFIGDSNTRISGLVPTEQGLLVFTTSSAGLGGVHILRGTPDAFTLEPLHVGIGTTDGQTSWQDTNTFCWITEIGEVWQTDTDSVRRLDRQGLGVDRQTSPRDGVRSFGPWLIAVRERRMFVLRALDDGRTAAWTEVNIGGLPGPPDMRFAAESGQSLYFLAGGEAMRFTRADLRTGISERGNVLDDVVDLSVGSRTMSTEKGHHKTFWHKVGVRATAGHRGTAASVERLILRGGPVLDVRTPSLQRVGPFSLVEPLEVVESSQSLTPLVEFTETWTCVDHATSITCEHPWVIINGSFQLLGNDAVSTSASNSAAYMDEILSSDDQFAKATISDSVNRYVFVRNPGTGAETHYRFWVNSEIKTIQKVIDGSVTTLVSEAAGVTAATSMELRASGTLLEALVDDVVVLTATDSDLSTGRFAGIGTTANAMDFQSFESGSLVPASTVLWSVLGSSAPIVPADVRSVSTAESGTTGSFSVTKPAGTVEGDLLVAFHSADVGEVTQMTISGGGTWNLLRQATGGTDNFHTKVWYRTAGASEPVSYGFSQDSGADGVATIAAIVDADTALAPLVDHVRIEAAADFITTPGVTPRTENDLDLRWAGADPSVGFVGLSPPTNYTEQSDLNSDDFVVGSLATRQLTSDDSIVTSFGMDDSGNTVDDRFGFTVLVAPVVPELDLSDTVDATWAGEQMHWDPRPADLLPAITHSPKRGQTLVRGIGASNEFSVEAVFRGDVQVEQISVFFQGSILGGTDEGR